MERKQITNMPILVKRNNVYSSNERPYEMMVRHLTEGKSEEESQKILEEFWQSHTYLLICERGYFSPWILTLERAYEAERKEGLVGFVHVLMEDIPTFFD